MRLPASVLVAVLSLGCASAPVSEEQRALNVCLRGDDQPGWKLLSAPPAIAQALRNSIVTSGQLPLPEPGDHEYWFLQSDGRYLRCTNTFGGWFESEGMPAVCGAFTYTFTRAGESWEVASSPLVMCNKRG